MAKKIPLVDPYEPCLCGSGEKYKFCCYLRPNKTYHNPNESYVTIEKNKQKPIFCLHKDCKCSSKIIKSHSIQNSKILSKLSVNNHVYTASYDSNETCGVGIKLRGKNEATTSNCFCSYHDTEIFKDIELKNYEYTEKQNFLYAYRAFSKAYYDKLSKRASDIYMFQNSNQICLSQKWIIDNMRGTIIDLKEYESLKTIFNNTVDNETYDVIETITATLDYEVSFATSYVNPVAYDFHKHQINDPWDMNTPRKNIFVNIFPEAGKTYILISWLKQDSPHFQEYKKQFAILQQHKELFFNAMNNMVACQSDNFAFSPALIDSWDKDTLDFFKDEFRSFFFGTSKIKNIGMEVEKNLVEFRCGFNLFENRNLN